MKNIPYDSLDSKVFPQIANIAKSGIFDGTDKTKDYLYNCRWFHERYECVIILTRDIGYHSSGWWKNPDYERCYHLSISFPGGRNAKVLKHVLDKLFGNNKHLLWCESPYSEEGKKNEVYHYRLFCDERWQPIKPRGEVYSTQFTERGWKSFSELFY